MNLNGRSVLAVLMTTALLASTVSMAGASDAAVDKAVAYVVSTQGADGSFFGGGQAVASSGGLAETLVALAAGEFDGTELGPALSHFATAAPEEMTRAAYVGRAIMALISLGKDPTSFGGYNYDAKLDSYYNPSGYWETQLFSNALAALGELASGDKLEDAAITWIKANQCVNGGFGFTTACGTGADVDTTSLIINVFAAQGLTQDDVAMKRARDFLALAQNAEGGFGYAADTETNANSTGLALSAIAALGEHPKESPWRVGEGKDPVSVILDLQLMNGGFRWKKGSTGVNAYATVQAIPGISLRPYPVVPIVASPSPTPTASPSPAPTASPSPTPTASPSPTPTASPSLTPTASPSPTPTASPSLTPTASPSLTPTASPSPTLVKTAVTIRFKRGAFRGEVRSDLSECVSARKVHLYKVRAGKDRRLGRETTADDGRWRVRSTRRKGAFYVRVRSSSVAGASCEPVRSRTLRR